MSPTDPYKPPHAPLDIDMENTARIEKVASGQKLIIYAILINIASILLQLALGPVAGLLNLVAIVLSLVGIVRLASGLGYSLAIKILLIILMFIPLINLITLLVINSKAINKLREAGYKVGLMGASK